MSGLLRPRALALLAPLLVLATALPALELQNYKESRRLLVGTVAVQVAPLRAQRVKSPSAGLLHLRLPRASGTALPSGTVWGEFDPERLALEREALALARTLLERKEAPRLRLETRREAFDLQEKRAEARRQLDMLRRIADDPELAGFYLDAPGSSDADSRDDLARATARLHAQISLMDEVLAYAGTPEHLEAETRALEIKLRQHELDFARRESETRLTMPFDGELTLLIERPAGDSPLRVELGAELALLQDFSAVQARLVVKRPEWRLLATERLHLHVRAGTAPLTADFQSSRLDDTAGRDDLVYLFRFRPSDLAPARRLVGGSIPASLFIDLTQPARIVPKLDLVLACPDAFREGDWQTGLAAALPAATLVAVGETELAIVPASP